MAKYRKKPIVIEAMQFDGTYESALEITEMWDGVYCETMDVHHGEEWTGKLCVNTLEGHMTCSPGDWIILGVSGEFYPCKDHIFQASYEPVED